MILPGLDVARRPVVQQRKPKDVVPGLADGDRFAEWVSGADIQPDLDLVIQEPRGAEAGDAARDRFGLPVRTPDLDA